MSRNLITRALESAGWSVTQPVLERRVFQAAVFINVLIAAYFVYRFGFVEQYPLLSITSIVVVAWVITFFFVLSGCWFMLFVFLDVRAYNRTASIEEVLPDFLQLTAANLRAGMTPDHALWYAVRPKFGALTEEIALTAKDVMTGEELSIALQKLSRRYKSPMLTRSMNLLVEGMNAGGDLADVLNNVAINIQETRILNKEMSANILTYVIFIAAAVMFAAPILLALAQQLLLTLGAVTAGLDIPSGVSSFGLFTLQSISISADDFQVFAYVMLGITSLFSAMIVAIIQKGSVEAGIKYIPAFILVSLLMFWLASALLGQFFALFAV